MEVKAERGMKPKRCDDRIDTVWVEDEYSMVKISPSMAYEIFFLSGIYTHLLKKYGLSNYHCTLIRPWLETMYVLGIGIGRLGHDITSYLTMLS